MAKKASKGPEKASASRKRRRAGKHTQADSGTAKRPQIGGVKLPDGWEEVFFDALSSLGNVRAACARAGVGKSAVYGRRSEDPEFEARWREALDDAGDVVEQEIFRRGVTGYDKPVFHKGVRVATVREYSDTLLIFLAKGLRPEKYRDAVSHSISGGLQHVVRKDPEHVEPTASNIQMMAEVLYASGRLAGPEDEQT